MLIKIDSVVQITLSGNTCDANEEKVILFLLYRKKW